MSDRNAEYCMNGGRFNNQTKSRHNQYKDIVYVR